MAQLRQWEVEDGDPRVEQEFLLFQSPEKSDKKSLFHENIMVQCSFMNQIVAGSNPVAVA